MEVRPGADDKALFESIIAPRKIGLLLNKHAKHRPSLDHNTQQVNNMKRNSMQGRRISLLQYYYSSRVPSPFKTDDMLQLEIETNPLQSTASSRIAMNIAPIEIAWNVYMDAHNGKIFYCPQ